jgi:hypothetical protein
VGVNEKRDRMRTSVSTRNRREGASCFFSIHFFFVLFLSQERKMRDGERKREAAKLPGRSIITIRAIGERLFFKTILQDLRFL